MIFSLQETYEAKRKEFLIELQQKEESMRQMFVNKVKEAEVELKEKEKEVRMEHILLLLIGNMVYLIYLMLFTVESSSNISSFTIGLNS